jgi:hypothetical protein
MFVRSFAQRLGLGKLALTLWHQPVGRMRDSLRNGGPFVERETECQRLLMAEAAAALPALPQPADSPRVALHLLTGRKYLFQAAYCLHSFARQSGAAIEAHIYDDGSFDDNLRRQLELDRLGAAIVFHPISETLAKLDALLPESRFPVLRERWRNYPNIRKLTDPHLGSTGWKLIMDSDLLFFRRPDFLLDWCAAPDRPLHAVDCLESYGYSRGLMEKLAGAPIPPLVNVGVCGLRSESIDWNEVEGWCAELIAREKTTYYLEQALVAMLVARIQPCAVAPATDYQTNPGRNESTAPTAVMHHYVAESKRWYYRHGWREVQRQLA